MNQQSGQQDAVRRNQGVDVAEDAKSGNSQTGSLTAQDGRDPGTSGAGALPPAGSPSANPAAPAAGSATAGSASPAAGTASPAAGSATAGSATAGTAKGTGTASPAAGSATAGTADGTGTASPAAGSATAGTAKGTGSGKNEAVVGPFTVRDLTVFGSTLILFVASLIPMFGVRFNLWNVGSLFFLGLGIILPLIVAALFVARRLSPDAAVRIGSLSVDQFASVVASFTLAFFFLSAAEAFVPSVLLALIGSLGLFAATVPARFIPFFAGDFLDRPESAAHVVARESSPPARKPRAPKAPKDPSRARQATAGRMPDWASRVTAGRKAAAVVPPAGEQTRAGAVVPPAGEQTRAGAVVPPAGGKAAAVVPPAEEQTQLSAHPTAGSGAGASAMSGTAGATPATTVNPQVRPQEPIAATVDPSHRPEEVDHKPEPEAFWFAVAQPRTAFDERTGEPAFVVEPGGWVLALEDRGHEFLVQHTDGRLGVLRDLSNIERG